MAGIRPHRLVPLNRGCSEKVIVCFRKNCKWVDKTDKVLYLTAKTEPWDNDSDDSDALFKVIGTIPDPAKEPGRVVFNLTKEQTYLDPDEEYFCDVVETDEDGENPHRIFIGSFVVIGGANNAQAGGEIDV